MEHGETRPETKRLLEEADLYHELGRGDEALRRLQRLLVSNPEDPEVLCRVSILYRDLGDLDASIDYAKQAVRADPQFERAFRLLSIASREQGLFDEAVAAAERAVDCAPEEPFALCVLADAQREAGLLEEAHATATRLVELDPSSMSHDTLGLVYFDLGSWTRAEHHFHAAVELNPESYPAMNNLGSALLHQDKIEKSLECFVQAARLRPNDEIAKDNIVMAAELIEDKHRGNGDEAGLLVIGILAVFYSRLGADGLVSVAIGFGCVAVSGASMYLRWRCMRSALPRQAREYLRYARRKGRVKRWLGWRWRA